MRPSASTASTSSQRGSYAINATRRRATLQGGQLHPTTSATGRRTARTRSREPIKNEGVLVRPAAPIITTEVMVCACRTSTTLAELLLLGAMAGAQTMTAGLAAVQERSGSLVAVLGYSGTVAVGHILLTAWGTAIVWLIA